MLFFIGLFLFVIVQRLGELQIAMRNEQWIKEQGAIEYGKHHYKYIVIMHSLFFVSLLVEVVVRGIELASWWWIAFSVFMVAQALRLWIIRSLGQYWNTKILVIPNSPLVSKGPYKYIRHPNYLVVAIEIVTIPLLFQAYLTAFVFSVLNAMILLFVRIPVEEQALKLSENGKVIID